MPESVNKLIIDCACRITRKIKAKAVLLHSDVCGDPTGRAERKGCDIILMARDNQLMGELRKYGRVLSIPSVELS